MTSLREHREELARLLEVWDENDVPAIHTLGWRARLALLDELIAEQETSTPPCGHLLAAVTKIRESAAGGVTAGLTGRESGDLWLYIVRLQDAVLAAEHPWPHGAQAGCPRELIESVAAEIRGLEGS